MIARRLVSVRQISHYSLSRMLEGKGSGKVINMAEKVVCSYYDI